MACSAAHLLLQELFVPAVCFAEECQAKADAAMLTALAVPLVIAAAAVAWILHCCCCCCCSPGNAAVCTC